MNDVVFFYKFLCIKNINQIIKSIYIATLFGNVNSIIYNLGIV